MHVLAHVMCMYMSCACLPDMDACLSRGVWNACCGVTSAGVDGVDLTGREEARKGAGDVVGVRAAHMEISITTCREGMEDREMQTLGRSPHQHEYGCEYAVVDTYTYAPLTLDVLSVCCMTACHLLHPPHPNADTSFHICVACSAFRIPCSITYPRHTNTISICTARTTARSTSQHNTAAAAQHANFTR